MERFNIADIVRIRGIEVLRETGAETMCVCPFCGDRRGKFSYTLKKGNKENLYKCFHCGASGSSIDLYINTGTENYDGEDGRKRAVKQIFRELNGDSESIEYHRKTEEMAKLSAVETADKASDARCSKVYYAMLKELTLLDAHRKDLLRRGFTEEDINRFRFRSIPDDPKRANDVIRKLLAKGFELEGVPGFYKDKKDVWRMSLPCRKNDEDRWETDTGYFCPVYDGQYNFILGFQIRLDNPREKAKYVWFSSAGRQSGVSSGAIATYLPGKEDEIAIVTEGILKATVIYSLLNGSVSVIGVPGVQSIKSINPYLERFEGRGYVFEAYDMDKAIRVTKETPTKDADKTVRIAQEKEKLASHIQDLGLPVHPLVWDMDKEGYWNGTYKGLDDFLCEYPDREKFVAYLRSKASETLKMQKYFAECA